MIFNGNDDSGDYYLLKGLLRSLLSDLFNNLKLEDLNNLNSDLEDLDNLNKLSGVSNNSKTCVDYYNSEIRLRKKTI